MAVTCVQYDDAGELVSVVQVLVTEGRLAPAPADATEDQLAEHAQRQQQAIEKAERQTRQELTARARTERLLVLDDGAEQPSTGGRWQVDPASRRLRRRTDSELAAHQASRAQPPAPAS